MRRFVFLGLLSLLAACSTTPFQVPAPESLHDKLDAAVQSNPGSVKPRVIAYCYGPRKDGWEALIENVSQHCSGETERLVHLGGDFFTNDCPMFQPDRAVFLCVDKTERTVLPPGVSVPD
ncbi:MAG: hypothetical protein WDZ84_08790 [Rhodovibrionaceae bacterium]